jgi:hypothetical protein
MIVMLTTSNQRPAVQTARGWPISVLHEAGAIREYETHGWMQNRADPHACERALTIQRQQPSRLRGILHLRRESTQLIRSEILP